MKTIIRFAILVVFSVGAPSFVHGQERVTERTDARLRERCENAARVITLRGDSADRVAAYRQMGSCEETGPQVLREMWRQPPIERFELDLLHGASRGNGEEGLVSAAEAVATNLTAPADARIAAMIYLASLLNSRIMFYVDDLDSLRLPAHLGGGVGRRVISHVPVFPPAEEPLRSRVVQTLEAIAQSDPTIEMRRVAEELLTLHPAHR